MAGRVMLIQDLSCLGKCSLMTAIPVMTMLGLEVCPLPSALLSTHTAFPDPMIRDLTEEMEGILAHWEKEGMTFEAICTGYLRSARQADIVKSAVSRFRTAAGQRPLLIVDPAMADHGKLYAGLDDTFVAAMRELCRGADYILPNLTEAALLLDSAPLTAGYKPPFIKAMLQALSEELSVGVPVITGVSYDAPKPARNAAVPQGITGNAPAPQAPAEPKIGAAAWISLEGRLAEYLDEKMDASYFGTGDLFTAMFSSMIIAGAMPETALRLAVQFVKKCMEATMKDPDRRDYGTSYEQVLGGLSLMIGTFLKTGKILE